MTMTFLKRAGVAVLSSTALIAGGLPLASMASAAPAPAPAPVAACATADYAEGELLQCALAPGSTIEVTLHGPDGSNGGAGGAGGSGGTGWTGSAVTQGGVGGRGGIGGAGGIGSKGVATYKNDTSAPMPISVYVGNAAAPSFNGNPGLAGANAPNFGPASAGGVGTNGMSGLAGNQGASSAFYVGSLLSPDVVRVEAFGGTGGQGGAFGTAAGGGPSTAGTGTAGTNGANGAPGTHGRIVVTGVHSEIVTVETLTAARGEAPFASVVVSSSSMKIRGFRGQGKNAGKISVLGRSEGLEGKKGIIRLKLAGDESYSEAGKVTIGADGAFTWSKVTNRKAYVRVVFADGHSNRIIIDARS